MRTRSFFWPNTLILWNGCYKILKATNLFQKIVSNSLELVILSERLSAGSSKRLAESKLQRWDSNVEHRCNETKQSLHIQWSLIITYPLWSPLSLIHLCLTWLTCSSWDPYCTVSCQNYFSLTSNHVAYWCVEQQLSPSDAACWLAHAVQLRQPDLNVAQLLQLWRWAVWWQAVMQRNLKHSKQTNAIRASTAAETPGGAQAPARLPSRLYKVPLCRATTMSWSVVTSEVVILLEKDAILWKETGNFRGRFSGSLF